jgi:hypothetical protein
VPISKAFNSGFLKFLEITEIIYNTSLDMAKVTLNGGSSLEKFLTTNFSTKFRNQ